MSEGNPEPFVVRATIEIKLYADDAEDALREAESHANWEDWILMDKTALSPKEVFAEQYGPDAFIVGRKYCVRYRLDSMRKDREFVGQYLGWNNTFDRHDFNFRPLSGTGSVKPADIIYAREAPNMRIQTPGIVD